MLGRLSADGRNHFDGEVDPDLSTDLSTLDFGSGCWDIVEGFLLNTFREDFPFNSGTGAALVGAGGLLLDLPNPNLCTLGLGSANVLVVPGEGERIPALGILDCCCDLVGCGMLFPLRGSNCVGILVLSAFLGTCLSNVGCQYVPALLSLLTSPGLFGGSKPALYDAILSFLTLHDFLDLYC